MNIRPFTGTDFEPIAKLLGTTWHSDHGKHSFWQGADELCDHLAQSDHGIVAEEDGVLKGVILLASANKVDHNETLRLHWLQQRTRISAMASALGVNSRADVVWLNDENALMQQAAEELGSAGVGEVVLLVMSKDARGKGMGKELLQQGGAWLAEHGATIMRLVTDDGCDWPFYEHVGMKRVLATTATADPTCGIYIYQAPIA